MSSDFLSLSTDILDRLLDGLKLAGVEKGSRNKTVAEKTGYSVGTVNRILSGNATLTGRFIQAVCTGFDINRTWVETGNTGTLLGGGDTRGIHGRTLPPAWLEYSNVTGDDSLTREAINEFKKLPLLIQKHVLGMMREINSAIEDKENLGG
ncbi:MAG: helix-turn-helix transcriptional regulator [Geobacteraceae bacterium]|nr:helix-turn-helix transcriptional regulator [Geobacteraceae bacterium]